MFGAEACHLIAWLGAAPWAQHTAVHGSLCIYVEHSLSPTRMVVVLIACSFLLVPPFRPAAFHRRA